MHLELRRTFSHDERVRLLSKVPAPAEREEGDPFAEGLSDLQRAARLIGRKIVTTKLWAGREFQVMYRVDHFRRFIPGRGLGIGLLDFYGPRAVRVTRIGEKPGAWTKEGDETFCHIVSVREPGESFKIK